MDAKDAESERQVSTRKESVLLIASQPFFEYRGSPIRLGFNLMALVRNGYNVDFLTLPVGAKREIEGVRIVRAPNLIGIKKVGIGPGFAKLFFDAVFLFQALGMALRNRYAVIHGVEDAGLIALIVGRLTRAKVIFEKHSDPHSHRKGRLSRTVLRAYAAVERLVMRRVDAVIGTGAGLVQQARKHAPQTPAFHISDIPSSLVEAGAAEVAAARERMQAEPGAVLALYVGSFAVYQGIDLLFGAMPPALGSSDKLKFVVVGGTPEQIAERRGQLAALGVAERVLFLGMISPDELPAYLAACDILLSPRVAGVNTPLKLLDYLKARRAIVATDHEANRLIVDESCARLAPLTAEGLADAIVTLAEDSSERERLAQAGARLIEERYNFEVFVSELKRCYDGLAK